MEQRIQHDTETNEIQPLPKEVNLGAGSFRVADKSEADSEERKTLLRRRLAGKVRSVASLSSTLCISYQG